jgi:hypothetical protein
MPSISNLPICYDDNVSTVSEQNETEAWCNKLMRRYRVHTSGHELVPPPVPASNELDVRSTEAETKDLLELKLRDLVAKDSSKHHKTLDHWHASYLRFLIRL